MRDRIEDLSAAFNRFPGIGPRQAKRFVYHLLTVPQGDRNRLADLIANLGNDVQQCRMCMRFAPVNAIARSLPSLINGSSVDVEPKFISMRPPSMSWMACAPPR